MQNTFNDKSYFMGRVTASVTHELQNVLAIIRETAGLMQDLLMMGDACENLKERLTTSLSSINNQVNRGVTMTHGLNGFAHTADDYVCAIDSREILERLLLLTERVVRNKGFTATLAPGASPMINGNPVTFQTICFLCVENMINALQPGQNIVLALEKSDRKAIFRIGCPDLAPTVALTQTAHGAALMEACSLWEGASLSLLEEYSGLCIVLPSLG